MGLHTITYDFTDAYGYMASASDDIEVFDLPSVAFSAPADICIDAGVQAGLGGGMPLGGIYSGIGVNDDGNGMTYSFDPAIAGVGVSSLTYTYVSSFSQIGLDIDGDAAFDNSSRSISLSSDGSRVAIGAPYNNEGGVGVGQVKIYEWNDTTWAQIGLDIYGEAILDYSGWSVSLSSDGNRVAIGAPSNDGGGEYAGHVRIYEWNGTAWMQLGLDIDGEAADDQSGYYVLLASNGNRVAIGARKNSDGGSNAGQVKIYDWNGTSWEQVGLDIDGEPDLDQPNLSISLSSDGNRLAIGEPYNFDGGSNAGQVRVYEWNGTAWAQLGLGINGEMADDRSGTSVSLSSDGTRIAIGAPYNDGGGDRAGHVRIYDWNGTAWVKVGLDIDGEAEEDFSGVSVSLSSDGNRVAIGAHFNDGGGDKAGHVRIYDWNGTAWVQVSIDIDGEADLDQSGLSVSLSSDGNRVAIGAFGNDGGGESAGHVRIYNTSALCTNSVTDEVEVFALPSVTFTTLTDLCLDAGVQNSLSGGTPIGGIYSGPGVTDDGNGVTYSFDPAAAGLGIQMLTYAFTDANGCSANTMDNVEVLAVPTITFSTDDLNVHVDAGVQTGLSGGMPAGGTYSGTGVTDDGNGMTYSFDPAAAGEGESVITYTYTSPNGCSGEQSAIITVIPVTLPGDDCDDAIDLSPLFGQAFNEPQTSDLYDNTGFTTANNDPSTGFDCFYNDDTLQTPGWFSFTGDGNTYQVRNVQCTGPNENLDLQAVVYSGTCGSLSPIVCNDDAPGGGRAFLLEFDTEEGVEYLILVDGYDGTVGEFCIEVTNQGSVSVIDLSNTEFKIYPNPTQGTIQLPQINLERVEAYDATGRLVINQYQPGPSIDLGTQPAGLYILKLYTGKKVYSAKVVKE